MRLRRLFSFLSVSLVGTVISGIRQGKTGRNSLLLVVQARVEEAVDEHAHQRRAELEGAGGEARGARLLKVLCDLHPWVRGQCMGARQAETHFLFHFIFRVLQRSSRPLRRYSAACSCPLLREGVVHRAAAHQHLEVAQLVLQMARKVQHS